MKQQINWMKLIKEVEKHRKNAESMSKGLNESYKKYNDRFDTIEDNWTATLSSLKMQYETSLSSLLAVLKNAGINTSKTENHGTD